MTVLQEIESLEQGLWQGDLSYVPNLQDYLKSIELLQTKLKLTIDIYSNELVHEVHRQALVNILDNKDTITPLAAGDIRIVTQDTAGTIVNKCNTICNTTADLLQQLSDIKDEALGTEDD